MRKEALALLQARPMTSEQLTRALRAHGVRDLLVGFRRRGWIVRVAGTTKHPVWARSKRCPHCPPGTPPHVLSLENFSPVKRDEQGRITVWGALCKPCAARKSAAIYYENHEARKARARAAFAEEMQDVERRNARRAYERVASQRRREEKPEMERARQQRYRARIQSDPVLREERRDQMRIDHTRVLEAQGLERAFKVRDLVAEEGSPLVRAAPFLRWWHAYLDAEPPTEDGGRSRDVLAESMGTSDRSIRRIEDEDGDGDRMTELDLVDRAFVLVGLDFITLQGLTPADEGYPGGGTPVEIPGPHLLRAYYPKLFRFVRVHFPPTASVEERMLIYLAADPTNQVRLAHKIVADPQHVRKVIKRLEAEGRVEVTGTEPGKLGHLPIYAPAQRVTLGP